MPALNKERESQDHSSAEEGLVFASPKQRSHSLALFKAPQISAKVAKGFH
jgi:hypothetical protein